MGSEFRRTVDKVWSKETVESTEDVKEVYGIEVGIETEKISESTGKVKNRLRIKGGHELQEVGNVIGGEGLKRG